MESTYLCVILHVKHRKIPIFSDYFLNLLGIQLWVKSNMANMFGDVTGFQQGYHPRSIINPVTLSESAVCSEFN